MSFSTSRTEQENVLSDLITEINNRIRNLEIEKFALERQLDYVRKNNATLHDVKRSSSVTRSIIEKHIYEIIEVSGRAMKSGDIEIMLSNRYFNVKPSTFRSYLKRMCEKGILQNVGNGRYIISTNK